MEEICPIIRVIVLPNEDSASSFYATCSRYVVSAVARSRMWLVMQRAVAWLFSYDFGREGWIENDDIARKRAALKAMDNIMPGYCV